MSEVKTTKSIVFEVCDKLRDSRQVNPNGMMPDLVRALHTHKDTELRKLDWEEINNYARKYIDEKVLNSVRGKGKPKEKKDDK
tara:strand:- start:865 stop:1113 length:249 start_codon:yes stop_codon:yes gene_type:complete